MAAVVDMRAQFRPASGEIPTLPGVYRFSDVRGEVLYIGKAKSLRQRLANYFQPWHTLAPRTQQMLSRARAVDWTVVASDTEALVLEQQWIREQQPPYNVVFRDDKSFPYLVVTLGHEAPRLEITRRTGMRGAKYYGPYPKVWALKQTLELINQAFAIRTCNDADYARAMRTAKPCLPGQVGKCFGPCSQRISIAAHRERVAELVHFLNTLDDKKVRQLEKQMRAAAAAQDYEKAARLRDKMLALEQVLETNSIVLSQGVSADFFGLYTDELLAVVHQFLVRDGRVRGERSWFVEVGLESKPEDLMAQVLQDAYRKSAAAKQIFVSILPAGLEAVQQVLRRTRPRAGNVSVRVPERGEAVKLLETAVRNAGEQLVRAKLKRTNSIVSRTEALAGLQDILGMSLPPLRIECVDVSHLQGTDVVASLVTFSDGLPQKSAYRKYKIAETTDDTDSIYQVVTRRAQQLLRESAELRAAPNIAQSPAQRIKQNERTGLEETLKEATVADRSADINVNIAATTASRAAAAAADNITSVFDAVVNAAKQRKKIAKPDLLLIDGGLPQANAAKRALDAAGITDITVCGIAKRLEELWLPGAEFPLILPRNSEELFLLQRVRDEAHRFALTFQRKQREKTVTSALNKIPGVGEARMQALLRHFGSIAKIREADVAEIASVPKIGKVLATQIVAALNNSA